jgi:hypothetical protein
MVEVYAFRGGMGNRPGLDGCGQGWEQRRGLPGMAEERHFLWSCGAGSGRKGGRIADALRRLRRKVAALQATRA